MHTALTPGCMHEARFCSLKKPRSEPYSCGAQPKACRWCSREDVTWTSSGGLPFSTSYCVIKPSAFGEEDFVTELDRRAHLAALDQVGMGLEDGINLLVGGH